MKPVNLLPESQRQRTAGGLAGSSYVVIGVLATLLVMVVVYVFTGNQATSRENDTAAASAEADRLEAQVATLGAFGDFAQTLQVRATSVRELAAARFDWERLMLELAHVLPEDSWLQAAEASTTGEAEGPSGVPGQPTLNVVGCTPQQSDVAALMLRMERMHRAETVTLNESIRQGGDEAPTLDSCGRFYKFDLDVNFTAVSVSEAPRGRTSVPPSLGGGS